MHISILWILLCCIINIQSADSDAVYKTLQTAQYELNYNFNYEKATQLFAQTITMCQQSTPENKEILASARIGQAMCHHHVGNYIQRNQQLEIAAQLVGLPEDPLDYAPKAYKKSAVHFFIVDAYRWYIEFEHSSKHAYPIEEQKTCLLRAKALFNKALTIDLFNKKTSIETAHAHHGLGTISEFLSKCETSKIAARSHLIDSIRAFRLALCEREKLFGKVHPQVARTHHKLARNYALAGEEQRANHHYEEALNIYDACGFPASHPKYQELLEEIIE